MAGDRTAVLLVGTGMLGSKIADALLRKGDAVDLHILARGRHRSNGAERRTP